MTKYLVDESSLKSVADAIRDKGETSGTLYFPTGFVSAISQIDTSGSHVTYESSEGRSF